MKLSLKSIGLTLAIVAASTVSFAQKKNETSAAVEFKNKYLPAFAKGDFETAKKALLTAKEFIDLAAANPETKDSQKTMWYKGEIYAHFLIVAMQTQDIEFGAKAGEDAIDQSINAFAHGYTLGKKYKSDIETSVYQKATVINGLAGMLYKAEQYGEAAEMYNTQARYSEAINQLDSSAVYNAALCYERSNNYTEAATRYEELAKVNYRGVTSAVLASSAYRKAGDIEKSKAIIEVARKDNPTNRELLLELVNANIDEGNAAGAQAALNDAIATDPNNKLLHFTIGTIYNELGENEQAEKALNKALDIDPDYTDAQYQLGAILVSWAGDVSTKAKQLEFGDPNYNSMMEESAAIYKRALTPLEKYIASYPDDKTVLNILFQIQKNLGNSEKALEYKKRHDAL